MCYLKHMDHHCQWWRLIANAQHYTEYAVLGAAIEGAATGAPLTSLPDVRTQQSQSKLMAQLFHSPGVFNRRLENASTSAQGGPIDTVPSPIFKIFLVLLVLVITPSRSSKDKWDYVTR